MAFSTLAEVYHFSNAFILPWQKMLQRFKCKVKLKVLWPKPQSKINVFMCAFIQQLIFSFKY